MEKYNKHESRRRYHDRKKEAITEGRTRVIRKVLPGPASQYTRLLLISNPGGTIVRRLFMINIPVIETPLPDIAMDVKETESVGGKGVHR